MSKIFFPQYVRGREGTEIVIGKTILDHIRKIGGVEIDSDCGGQGICGMDIVRIDEGSECLAEINSVEKKFLENGKLRTGQRLACQAKIVDDSSNVKVFMTNFGKYTILMDTMKTDVELNPSVFNKNGRVVYQTGEYLGRNQGDILGLAIDIGTTTLVMQVVDLVTGENVGNPVASKNPQIAYGNDVISRAGHTMVHRDGLYELQEAVIDGINRSLEELEKQLNVAKESITGNIYDVVAVGNSTMRSIFFGQDIHDLGVIPFEPSGKEALTRKASGLGLKLHPQAMAYGPSLIGGHAGADCLADIIATRLYQSEEVEMIIDIGTNGEVAIGNKDRIITASCAAGGAYEGYQIGCGVGAIEGAITTLRIDDGRVIYETLGKKHPVGVCGSGVIDLLAELFRNGIINEGGRIKGEYHITDGIFINQEDINQLIIAKAGLRTDQDLLIKYFGTNLDGVSKIYLAGAFGNYMNIDNAMAIGLLPKADKSKFIRYGNGALAGARDMLLSQERRRDAERVASTIEHTKPNEIEGEDFVYMVALNMYLNA